MAYGVRDIHNLYDRPGFPDDQESLPHEDQYLGCASSTRRRLDYLANDLYDCSLKPLTKQPGCTAVERDSFRDLILGGGRRVDGLRHFHPSALGAHYRIVLCGQMFIVFICGNCAAILGVFSYWTQRTGNRPFNRGLRLDYTVVTKSLIEGKGPKLVDSFVLDSVSEFPPFTDHAPVGALIK